MMKLTPKGKRFADVIKRYLENPNSEISKAVRSLAAWKRIVASNPKRYRLEADVFGGTIVIDKKASAYSTPEQISHFHDVSLWWPEDND